MAKFVGGPPPFIGTRDNLTIYFMKGEYIVRTKSSLTGKRVKRDPAFARTMENAGRLKKASGIASLIYRQMPADSRVYKQYRELVGKAMGLLKDGFDADDVLIALESVYVRAYVDDSFYFPDDAAVLSVDHPADPATDHLVDHSINHLANHLINDNGEIVLLREQSTSYFRKTSSGLEKSTLFKCFIKDHPSRRKRTGGGRLQMGISEIREIREIKKIKETKETKETKEIAEIGGLQVFGRLRYDCYRP